MKLRLNYEPRIPVSAESVKASLYERLGGVYRKRMVYAQSLNWQVKMMCWATGGPQQYTGRSMSDSHAHLKITPLEWDVFIEDLKDSLDKFQVPPSEQQEVTAILESTHNDIVVDA